MTERVIRVVLDGSGVVRGQRQVQSSLNGIQQGTRGVTRGLKAAATAATALIATLSVRSLIRTADAYAQIQNRLRVVTDSTDELTAANDRLFAIAQDTRQEFDATVSLYSRASIAAKELGASQEQLFQLVEITGQALAIQGGAASESSGALRQLSQAFSSGIVRAEEFNSILEGAFPLAQAAARGIDGLGGSVGKLRQLVIKGELSSREFFDAILEGGKDLDDVFAKTVPTVAQSLTVLNNSFTQTIGKMDQQLGITVKLSETIIDLSSSLPLLAGAFTGTLGPSDDLSENLQGVAIAGILAGQTIDSIISVLGIAKALFVDFGESLGGIAAAASLALEGNFSGALDVLNQPALDDTQMAFTDFFESLDQGATKASDAISQVLLPAFRDIKQAKDEVSEDDAASLLIPTETTDEIKTAGEAVGEFIQKLDQARTQLQITRDEGEFAGEAIRKYKDEMALAAAENKIFGDLVPTDEVQALRQAFREFTQEAIADQQTLRDEIEASDLSATFGDQIEKLQQEIELLDANNEAIAANAAARAIAAGATGDQAKEIERLTEVLLNEQDELRNQQATLEGFFKEVGVSAQRELSGFIADPLSDGLDELPFRFAKVLQQMAADALASEIFGILRGFGGNASGGGAGGALQFLGGLFGGGFASGGQVMGGRPIMVGERGPELFTPPGSGAITPNVNINQAAQATPVINVLNVTDPADIPAGLRTAEGEQEIINIIQRNPDQVRRILG